MKFPQKIFKSFLVLLAIAGAQVFFVQVTEAKVCVTMGEQKICVVGENDQRFINFNNGCDFTCGNRGLDCEVISSPNTCAEWDAANPPIPPAAPLPVPDTPASTRNQNISTLPESLKTSIKDLDKFHVGDSFGANKKSFPQIIGGIVKIGMGFIGALALIIFIYGGIIWMLDTGNSDRKKKAFDTLFWGGLGVAVIFASYALVTYIFQAFQ